MLSAVIHASMILLGVLLIVAYAQMQKSMPNVTATSDVGRAMEGLYTMGVMFLSVGLSLALLKVEHSASTTHVTYFVLLLGLVLTTLAGILVSKTSGTARNWAIAILVIGVLFIAGCGTLIAGKHSGVIPGLSYCSM